MIRFLSVYQRLGAEKYLKAASNDFEKAKKMCKKEALKIDHEEHYVNIGDGNTENPANIEVDNDDGEEEEYENEGEESDPYEGYEEEEIFLQSQSYLDPDDNSMTYLQELFGAFPYNEAVGGDKIQDSEEEYQIYEPDSNDNDFD